MHIFFKTQYQNRKIQGRCIKKYLIAEVFHGYRDMGVISKTCSPFNYLIWPVLKSNGEWRLTVDYCGLKEVTPSLNAAVLDMLEPQYEPEFKAAKRCHHGH